MSSRRGEKLAHRTGRTEQRRAGGTVGTLDVLSVGHGHMKVTITPGDEVEIDKARRMIEDMLKRGFSIFVEVEDGSTRRVKRFDPKKMIYFVDPPDAIPPAADDSGDVAEPVKKRRGPNRGGLAPVPVARARATAVGRMAGG